MQNRYTVIIPVYGALECLKKCLQSVLKNTPEEVNIVVIDDASREGDVLRYLKEWRSTRPDNAEVTFHDRNLGFVRTANEGMQRAFDLNSDPILLNSDTIVPPGWVERLDEARRSSNHCCSVSPLSNECAQFSVPNQWSGELPNGVDTEAMDRIVQETSGQSFLSVPCSIGFCMLMTREAIAEVGMFDLKWGKGYGEETDWCLRARMAGFECILADHLFVYHKHRASFGKQSRELRLANQELFIEQYPLFEKELEGWTLRCEQRYHRTAIANRLRPRAQGENRLRVLYVLHHWGEVGGLEIFTKRLVNELVSEVEITVLYPARGDMVEDGAILQDSNGVMRIVMSPRLVESKVTLGLFPFDFAAPHVEKFFADVLEAINPDVVHFHHLGGFGTFKLPEIAQDYGKKVVLSVHDDFYLCPSYITAGWSCGRDVAKNCEQCRNCVNEYKDVNIEGRYDWGAMLEEREEKIREMFTHVDALCFPSATIRDRYDANLELPTVLHTIPHGVPRLPVIQTYHRAAKLRIAWVGGCLAEKGWATFAEVARRLATDERFEFSVLGEWHQHADRRGLEHVRWHGRYEPHELPQLLQSVDLAIPAVARKEAFGLVVNEIVASYCAMLLPDVPTMTERFPASPVWYQWGDADSLEREVRTFADSVANDDIESKRQAMHYKFRTMAECALDYCRLYLRLVQ